MYLDCISTLFATGMLFPEIRNKLMKSYKISNTQAYLYIRKWKQGVRAELDKDRENNLSMAIKTKDFLYKQALDDNDTKTANLIHDAKCKLQGLYIEKSTDNTSQPVSINISIQGTDKTINIKPTDYKPPEKPNAHKPPIIIPKSKGNLPGFFRTKRGLNE
jgi:hypothetical protein